MVDNQSLNYLSDIFFFGGEREGFPQTQNSLDTMVES